MATHEHIIVLARRFAIGFLQRSCPRRLNEARDCVPFSVALMPSSAQRVPHFKANTYGGTPRSVASISVGRDCMHGCTRTFWGKPAIIVSHLSQPSPSTPAPISPALKDPAARDQSTLHSYVGFLAYYLTLFSHCLI